VNLKAKKAPKGYLNPPGAYCMGIFWKIHFINPPEVRGQVVRLKIKRTDYDGQKIDENARDVKGKNSKYSWPNAADFRLECCILKENPKNSISGSNVALSISTPKQNALG
jgi:hypothetical protein